MCARACVRAGVCGEPGKDRASGRTGGRGNDTISKADTAPEAVSSFGETQSLLGFPSLWLGLGTEDMCELQVSLKETYLNLTNQRVPAWGKNPLPACKWGLILFPKQGVMRLSVGANCKFWELQAPLLLLFSSVLTGIFPSLG